MRLGPLLASPVGCFCPDPPPPAVLAPAPPLSTLVFPPSRAPFCSPAFLPCPACPPLSHSALSRTGTLHVSLWAEFLLGSLVPAFCPQCFPPVTLSGPVFAPVPPPPTSPASLFRALAALLASLGGGGGGALVLSFPPGHARCKHDESTWHGTSPRGGSCSVSVRSALRGRPARHGFPRARSVGGGVVAFLAPSGALPASCPRCWRQA